jgi:hypothetical protein
MDEWGHAEGNWEVPRDTATQLAITQLEAKAMEVFLTYFREHPEPPTPRIILEAMGRLAVRILFLSLQGAPTEGKLPMLEYFLRRVRSRVLEREP